MQRVSVARWVSSVFRDLLWSYYDSRKFWRRSYPEIGLLIRIAWLATWLTAQIIDALIIGWFGLWEVLRRNGR